jgi:uncharacterized protein YoxC
MDEKVQEANKQLKDIEEAKEAIAKDYEISKSEIEQLKTDTNKIKQETQKISDDLQDDINNLAHLSGAEFKGVVKFPTASESTNDTTGATTQYVQNAILKALTGYTKLNIEIVSALPTKGVFGTFYFVPNEGTGNNVYNEYLWYNDKWEMLGTKEIDLSGYAKKTDLETAIKNNLNGIVLSVTESGILRASWED